MLQKTIIKALVIFFYSLCLSANDSIFSLIKEGRNDEVVSFLEHNSEISYLRDDKEQSPLVYAINSNQIETAHAMAKHPNYSLQASEISFLGRKLFGIRSLRLKKTKKLSPISINLEKFEDVIIMALEQAKIIRKMNMEEADAAIHSVCKIAPLFSDRATLSDWIQRRYRQKRISQEDLEFLCQNFVTIFLDCGQIEPTILKKIIENLYKAVSLQVLANFMFCAHEQRKEHEQDYVKLTNCDDVVIRGKFNIAEDPLMLAIFNQDLAYFRDFSIADLYHRAVKSQVENGTPWGDRLYNFVRLSILIGNMGTAKAHYKYWYKLMKKLKKKRDFFGASSIARALDNCIVTRIFPQSFLDESTNPQEFDFIALYGNHKGARDLEVKFAEESCFLEPSLFFKDIALFNEREWTSVKDGQPIICPEFLNCLKKTRMKLEKMKSEAEKLKVDSPLKGKIEMIPTINEELITALSEAFKPYGDPFVESLDANVRNWSFSDIVKFLWQSQSDGFQNKKTTNSPTKKHLMGKQEKYWAFLNSLILDLGILNGEDLLAVLTSGAYAKHFRLNFYDADEFSQVDDEQTTEFFDNVRGFLEKNGQVVSPQISLNYPVGKERFRPLKLLEHSLMTFCQYSLTHSQIWVSPRKKRETNSVNKPKKSDRQHKNGHKRFSLFSHSHRRSSRSQIHLCQPPVEARPHSKSNLDLYHSNK